MNPHGPDDFEKEVRLTRDAMKRTDLVTLATIALARGHAECARAHFPDHELKVVAKVMLHSTGCLGTLVKTIPGVSVAAYSTTNSVLNVQACAAVMILDQLEIEQLEASLKAES